MLGAKNQEATERVEDFLARKSLHALFSVGMRFLKAFFPTRRHTAPLPNRSGSARAQPLESYRLNRWPRVGLGYTYASGDSNPNDNRNETFDLLFGTHRNYGLMDLWNLRNIHSARVVASFKPLKKLSLSGEYHVIWLADGHDFFYPDSGSGRNANGYGRNPQFNNFVGSELDLLADWQVTRYANLQVGYGHFFVGDYIKQSVGSVHANNGAVDADWFYAQMRFNF